MAEQGTKKIIALSKANYRNFTIYELGDKKFGVVIYGRLVDDFETLGEVKGFIDSYYAQKQYRWN